MKNDMKGLGLASEYALDHHAWRTRAIGTQVCWSSPGILPRMSGQLNGVYADPEKTQIYPKQYIKFITFGFPFYLQFV